MDLIVERFGMNATFGALEVDSSVARSARVRDAVKGKEAAAALRAIGQLPAERRWDLHAGPRALGEGVVTVLHPSETRLLELLELASVGPNRLSSALMVEWRGRSVLLGADLERPEWVGLPLAAHLRQCDPVKVPHHGSSGAFDKTWAGDKADTPDNVGRRMLISPFDRHPRLPDIDDPKGLPALLQEVDSVHLTSVPFRTVPSASGALPLRDLRAARDAATSERPPLPAALGSAIALQTDPPRRESWLRAELAADGVCLVRGGVAHVNVIR
jgi:hypothetical protein